jgi:hypothetical protein
MWFKDSSGGKTFGTDYHLLEYCITSKKRPVGRFQYIAKKIESAIARAIFYVLLLKENSLIQRQKAKLPDSEEPRIQKLSSL